ncbi:hypothetical protein ACJX0J_038181, partial [Zea mays]
DPKSYLMHIFHVTKDLMISLLCGPHLLLFHAHYKTSCVLHLQVLRAVNMTDTLNLIFKQDDNWQLKLETINNYSIWVQIKTNLAFFEEQTLMCSYCNIMFYEDYRMHN